ncbi:MAG: nucleoside triphosphate pyrophosphohydrolase [Bacteroidales bacterium]|nr:nucleoside triphosphate pyrophosphohydrolase [Bacteroidales bacterium]
MNKEDFDRKIQAFERLLNIVDEVRAKCPWDSIQTIESIRHLTIEETYELSEAILANDLQDVKKELGDLMLHIALYSKMADEQGAFDIADVLNGISEKMIVRHPHIFGSEHVENANQVSQNWEKIKLEKEHNRSVLGGVPEGLPALLKAYRMQQKAAGVGFEWTDAEGAWQAVEEEKLEFLEELKAKNEVLNPKGEEPKTDNRELITENLENEFGDLLFALINYGRMQGINAEDALDKTNRKFRRRFNYVEQKAREKGIGIQNLSPEEMIAFWDETKALENK